MKRIWQRPTQGVGRRCEWFVILVAVALYQGLGFRKDVCIGSRSLRRVNARVDWVALGEGYHEGYRPTDPTDAELLRFDVLRYDLITREWAALEGLSYCTQFPATATNEQCRKGLAIRMQALFDDAQDGWMDKAQRDRLSGVGLDWLDQPAAATQPVPCAHCGEPVVPGAGCAAFCIAYVHDDCLHEHICACVHYQTLENEWDRANGWRPTWQRCCECGGTVCRQHVGDVACGAVVHGSCRDAHARRCAECQSIAVTTPLPSSWIEVLI